MVKAETLREAQKNPGACQSLIVRVAGYSDYFNNHSKTLQDEIISKMEHPGYQDLLKQILGEFAIVFIV